MDNTSDEQDQARPPQVSNPAQLLHEQSSEEEPSDIATEHPYSDRRDDELQRKLRPKARHDASIQEFLRNYSQCKDREVGSLLESMIEYRTSEPPYSHWLTDPNLRSSRLSVSGALDQFRTKLRTGGTGCVRLW